MKTLIVPYSGICCNESSQRMVRRCSMMLSVIYFERVCMLHIVLKLKVCPGGVNLLPL